MPLPAGTVTLLFTDVEGSTRLWEQHPKAMRGALARHDALATSILARHGGKLVKKRGEGDSLFAVFPRATDALNAACELQKAFVRELWAPETPLRVRMALHTGETELRGADYYGVAVNRCARLRSLARGGQVILSQATEQLVRDGLPAGAHLEPLGEVRLRDLERPEQVFQLIHPDLPKECGESLDGAAQANGNPPEAEAWRVELFGGLRLRRGEQVLTRLETRKAEALVAYLAFFRTRPHPR
uniref:Cyclase homology domain / Predicted ATPase / Transcriptional regulator, LuxR family n=1 Tax=uncultured Armatimonadetes bacterium TaxID=157466 RepID=A0A6J4J4T2_9BACT|nr:Cyclase homology domain / Predicted ATPase / Transcriptional regulator, LuxR family [uncultured Armatimonadetes bacterium]